MPIDITIKAYTFEELLTLPSDLALDKAMEYVRAHMDFPLPITACLERWQYLLQVMGCVRPVLHLTGGSITIGGFDWRSYVKFVAAMDCHTAWERQWLQAKLDHHRPKNWTALFTAKFNHLIDDPPPNFVYEYGPSGLSVDHHTELTNHITQTLHTVCAIASDNVRDLRDRTEHSSLFLSKVAKQKGYLFEDNGLFITTRAALGIAEPPKPAPRDTLRALSFDDEIEETDASYPLPRPLRQSH